MAKKADRPRLPHRGDSTERKQQMNQISPIAQEIPAANFFPSCGLGIRQAWDVTSDYMYPRAEKGDRIYTRAGGPLVEKKDIVIVLTNGVVMHRVLANSDATTLTVGRFVYSSKWELGDLQVIPRAEIRAALPVIAWGRE